MDQKFNEFSGFKESDKSLKHELNLAQFRDSFGYPCLGGTVVASWSLTRSGGDRFKSSFRNIIFLSLNSANSIKTFRENWNAISPN